MTAGALAKALGLKDRSRIEQLVRGQRAITADTALRLAKAFGTSAEYWMDLQVQYDLSRDAIASREALADIQPLVAAWIVGNRARAKTGIRIVW